MSSKNFFVPFFFIAGFLMSSCTFYKPTVLNTPIIEEKGELVLGVSVISSTDVYLVYSPIEHIAVKGEVGTSYTVSYESTDIDGNAIDREVSNVNYEFAAGYYNDLGKDFRFQAFGGYAFGESGSLLEDVDGFFILDGLYSAEYTNAFLQASVHKELNDGLFLGLNSRFNFLNYSNMQVFADSIFIDGNTSATIDDPSKFVGQVGLSLNFKRPVFGGFGQIQYGFSPDETAYFSVRNWGMHFGIYFRVDALFRGKEDGE